MRTPLILVSLLSPLVAGELRVITPTDDLAAVSVESTTTGKALDRPEPTGTQDGQLTNFTFRNVEPGKYRVSYLACDNPLAFVEVLMETLVAVGESSNSSVYLYRPRDCEQLKVPKDIEDFLRLHENNFMELEVVYDGSKTRFDQASGGAWSIRYLRDD